MFDKIKANLLRIFGKNDAVEQATNEAELDTALDQIPALSEQITAEVAEAKDLVSKDVMASMNDQMQKLINELNTNIGGIIESQNKKIEQVAKAVASIKVEGNKPAPIVAADVVPPTPIVEDTKGKPADYDLVMSAVNCIPITKQF